MTRFSSAFCLATLMVASATWAAPPACPRAAEIEPAMLAGSWRVEWTDGARQRGEEAWTLVLVPHPEYAGSLKGHLSRGNEHRQVVADWDDEALTMEESGDGQRIDATWQATASQGQCGRVLQGLRFTGSEPDASARRFRMKRQP